MAVQVSRHPAAPPRLCLGAQASRCCLVQFCMDWSCNPNPRSSLGCTQRRLGCSAAVGVAMRGHGRSLCATVSHCGRTLRSPVSPAIPSQSAVGLDML